MASAYDKSSLHGLRHLPHLSNTSRSFGQKRSFDRFVHAPTAQLTVLYILINFLLPAISRGETAKSPGFLP